MTIITRIKQLFTKKASKNLLSLVIKQELISYGYFSLDNSQLANEKPLLNTITILNNDLSTPFKQLTSLPIQQADCHIILSAKHYHIVQINKPKLPENELLEALTWQIKDLVPIEPNDMVIDYFDAPMLANMEKINVICASQQQLKSLVGYVNQDNISISKIIPEEFAFSELLPESSDATLLLCQQPNEDLLILIVKNSQLFSYRRIRSSADIGLRTADQLTMGVIDNLSIEIQKSIDYFERQLKQSPVRSIKVLLPIEKESFIARKLSENTLLPVELLTLTYPYNDERAYALNFSSLVNAQNEAKKEEALSS